MFLSERRQRIAFARTEQIGGFASGGNANGVIGDLVTHKVLAVSILIDKARSAVAELNARDGVWVHAFHFFLSARRTWITLLHFGHRILLPAVVSGTRILFPHDLHSTKMATVHPFFAGWISNKSATAVNPYGWPWRAGLKWPS
jgi:hypothetical protein